MGDHFKVKCPLKSINTSVNFHPANCVHFTANIENTTLCASFRWHYKRIISGIIISTPAHCVNLTPALNKLHFMLL